MKLVLIGYSGSGKSTLGVELAKRLNLPFVEMDEIILRRSKRESIVQIFDLDGEESFRNLESELCQELGEAGAGVISSGGGVVMRAENLTKLKKNGSKVLYLKSSFEEIELRLKQDTLRPLFRDKARAKALYDLRDPLYLKWADIIVSTDGKSPSEVISEILSELKGN